MAHISSIRIANFRNIRNQAIVGLYCKHPHTINMFVGGNASGKTSLLDAINLATSEPMNQNVDVEWTEGCNKTCVFFRSNRHQSKVGGVQISLIANQQYDDDLNRIATFVAKTVQSQSRRAVGRYAGTAKNVQWLGALNMFWSLFRNNGTTFDTDFVSPEDFDNPDWNLFLFKGDERICSVDEMSAGEVDAIAFAVPFITMPNSYYNGVVLIDDIEAHMTQEWATSLLLALRTMLPEAQFIVTTRLTGWSIPDCAVYDMGAITGRA